MVRTFETHSKLFLEKERYAKELIELTKGSKTLTKPKKPLTPYMLFVREVSL